jgi:imidazolonepropionase-like amidohydrolase
LAALPLSAAGDAILLRNATVHPVTGADISNGSVLIEDGKIVEVGARAVAPKGAKVIDLKGLHVYPGMIDSATELGMSEISSIRETDDTRELGMFNPQLRASIAVNPSSEHIPATRVNGITTAMVFPAIGGGRGFASLLNSNEEPQFILGQSSLMSLDGWTWEEMEFLRSAGMVFSLPATPPDTSRFAAMLGIERQQTTFAERKRQKELQFRRISEFLEQARAYARAKAANTPGLKTDLKMEAMIPVVEGKVPVITIAVREKDIREAVEFADKEKLKLVLAEIREPGKMTETLAKKQIPVILGPTLALPMDEDDRYDQQFVLPSELFKAGVKIAFGSFGNQFARNLPYQAAQAVAFGLPQADALKAVTINAAEIWGVQDRIGSIEKGKLANLVVTDGDPLESRTQIKHLFIKGKEVSLETKHTRLYEKYLNRP